MQQTLGLFFALLWLTLSSANATLAQTSVPKDWKQYSCDSFTIAYPPTWQLQHNPGMGMALIIGSSLSDSTDNFRENVNLVIQDLGIRRMSIGAYIDLSVKQLKALMTDFSIVDSVTYMGNGRHDGRLRFKGTIGEYDFYCAQHIWLTGRYIYLLTYTAERRSKGLHDETAKAIVQSFVLTPK